MSHGLKYGDAGRRVLALVSGLRPEARMTRRFLVLQAYIDESCTRGPDGSLFVMAGYIATVEDWMAFSDEWASLLTLKSPHYRHISEFHMNEMAQSPVALEQSELFYRIIEKHLHVHISCSIRLEDLRTEYQRITWPDWLDNLEILTNEYFAGFDQIIRGLALHQDQLGLHEPIDIIFDEHTNKTKCLVAWDYMKRGGHPEIRKMLGDTPIFRDSSTTMPLQAADMLAYWLRASQLKKPISDPEFKLQFPWPMKTKAMAGLSLYMTPEMIRNNFRGALLACSLSRAGVSDSAVQAIVSPKKK